MTFQEAFDKVLTEMRGRGYKRAVNSAGQCVMCTEDGTQCAVGILADAKADEPSGVVVARAEGLFSGVERWKAHSFLCRMQRIHDTGPPLDMFESGMRLLATRYDLVYQAP